MPDNSFSGQEINKRTEGQGEGMEQEWWYNVVSSLAVMAVEFRERIPKNRETFAIRGEGIECH